MKRVLITPMDWGLGHATRCIPIIRELLNRNCVVFIAGSGDSLLLLKNEFPFLTFFTLPGYNPMYSSGDTMVGKMALQLTKFYEVIKNEHKQVEALVDENKIDLVISDNRYGCYSKKVPSVILTHQINILMPRQVWWLAKLVRKLNERMIRKFSFCWVPDYPDKESSLAGKLSLYEKDALPNIIFVGPLSRFHPIPSVSIKYDVACIFSGPEPQRSILEERVTKQLQNCGLRHYVVRGILSQCGSSQIGKADFLNSEALQTVISQSSIVITRSGYSMIMDLAALGKKAIFVPTPGQTEQEYLADRWKEQGVAYAMPQHAFNLKLALEESNAYSGFSADACNKDLLNNALNQILKIV